jgi:hypothetical protein
LAIIHPIICHFAIIITNNGISNIIKSLSRTTGIEIDYEVGANTAIPTVNALFHSIVSTHSFMTTIDIVDYYLGAILPSPESVRIDVSSMSLPALTKFGLLPFLRHSHGKPFLFCDVLKTVPGLP